MKPPTNSEEKIESRPKGTRRRARLCFLVCWTILAAMAVWWLIQDSANPGQTVIRLGPDETKHWTERFHETIALARINSPWALAWILLTPYALWAGARFSLEPRHWHKRLAVLILIGAAFVAASQWFASIVSTGHTMIVMVNYNAEATLTNLPPSFEWNAGAEQHVVVSNSHATNRVTKVMVSASSAHFGSPPDWEAATSDILTHLPTNLPPVLGKKLTADLPPLGPQRMTHWTALLDVLAYVALVGLAHAGVFHRRYREREEQAALLSSRLSEAKLRALQAQLQPHFLFNSLNGIATLLRRDPAKAEDMLLSLSELLRLALGSSNRQEIPLREELEFLDRYLAIQKMRFGDRIEVILEIEPATMDCVVPALLLQPLVENAVRHGFEPTGIVGRLRISAAIEAKWLKLTVADNGAGLNSNNEIRSGVGLANVQERLATLHGNAYEFELMERPEGGVAVHIRLPAKPDPGANPRITPPSE